MGHGIWVPTSTTGDRVWLDLLDGRRSINQRQMRRKGLSGWQAATTTALLTAWELTRQRQVFLDVGANAGLYALMCRRLHDEATVVAFEPTDEVAAVGRELADANGLDVRYEQVAVSDAVGEADLYLSAKSDASNSLHGGFKKASGVRTVPTTTLDAYCEARSLVPRVVKIDVEKHEPAVLRGARGLLTRHRPVVVIELLTPEAGDEAVDELEELGYVGRRLLPPDGRRSPSRDWIFWPDQIPDDFDERFAAWWEAVITSQT